VSTSSKETLIKRLVGAAIFLGVGFLLTGAVPTREIAWVSSILLLTIYLFVFEIVWVSSILLLTIYLFVFEIVEVDVAAICIMVLLGLMSLIGPLFGLNHPFVPTQHLFDGFASNAVMSIIAVMIIGKGLDKTGVMNIVAAVILKRGGKTEKRIIPLISSTVAIISSRLPSYQASCRTSAPLPCFCRSSVVSRHAPACRCHDCSCPWVFAQYSAAPLPWWVPARLFCSTT